jgi:hypothetical protein
MGLDYESAKDAKPGIIADAKAGEAAAASAASADKAAVELTGGNRPIEEVIQKSQGDLIKVRQIINQGGFSGPERDKYVISLHHAEWVQSRNAYIDCDDNIEKKSVEYTALVKGKAQSHEIIKAHKEWENVRNNCKKSRDDVTGKAKQYIETDRRVRENKKAESEIFPVIEGFQISREGVKEGFNFYDRQDISLNTMIGSVPNQVWRYNVRLPLSSDPDNANSRATTSDISATIIPWTEYYIVCNQQEPDDQQKCKGALHKKNDYAVAINREFQRANNLLNTYYNVSTKKDSQFITLLEEPDIKSILENQKKNIALIKQNALYDYDEYNSLAFYEDLVFFLYYALFTMFVFFSLREYFSSSSYDYKNIAIVIILGIYPKYILPAVLWLLDVLTKSTEMLGLKNVRFWE